jgi:hypothetical protein
MKQKSLLLKACLLLITFVFLAVDFHKIAKLPHPEPPGRGPVVVTPRDGRAPGVVNFQSRVAKNAPAGQPVQPYQSSPALAAKGQKYFVINNKVYPLRTYEALMVPNDPSGSQWSQTNTKMFQAWDTPRGPRQTVLAVIDTGFGLQHEEFANRWYVNSGESGPTATEAPSSLNCSARGLPVSASCNLIDDDYDGIIDNEAGPAKYQNPSRLNCSAQHKALTKDCNRIDDDGNGYIDDISGWDFINNDNLPQAGELNPGGTGTQHGTEVTGVAAATGNNSKGIAGADWGTKIMPLQAMDDDSYGDTLSIGRAVYYAADQGADVITLSLGSSADDPYVEEAVQYAIAKGVVVVAAAGNNSCNCMVYPANYPEVVGVGALSTSGQRASFSSWGDNLDLMAPGVSLTSTTWRAGSPTNAYASNLAGTSFAAPMVAGLLTRMLSYQSQISPLQLIAALTENTNRLTIPDTLTHDSLLGFGGVDAQKATGRMITPKNLIQEYAFNLISKGQQLNPAQPAETAGDYDIYRCDDGLPGTTPVFNLRKGDNQLFSASPSEVQQAEAQGYTANLFAYFCLAQPQDQPQSVRVLNIYNEF